MTRKCRKVIFFTLFVTALLCITVSLSLLQRSNEKLHLQQTEIDNAFLSAYSSTIDHIFYTTDHLSIAQITEHQQSICETAYFAQQTLHLSSFSQNDSLLQLTQALHQLARNNENLAPLGEDNYLLLVKAVAEPHSEDGATAALKMLQKHYPFL